MDPMQDPVFRFHAEEGDGAFGALIDMPDGTTRFMGMDPGNEYEHAAVVEGRIEDGKFIIERGEIIHA
jgi:hypothetical protein